MIDVPPGGATVVIPPGSTTDVINIPLGGNKRGAMVFVHTPKWYFEVPHVQNGIVTTPKWYFEVPRVQNGILMVFIPTPKWYFEVPCVQNGILCSCVSVPAKGTYLKFNKMYLKILGYVPKNLKISTQVLSHAVPHWLAPYLTATPLEPKAEQHTHTQAPSGSGRVSVSQILQASSPYAPLLLRGWGQKDG